MTYIEVLCELRNSLKENKVNLKCEKEAQEANKLNCLIYRDEKLNQEEITSDQDNLFIKIIGIHFPDLKEDDEDPLTNVRIKIFINGETKYTKILNNDFTCNESFNL